MTDLTANDVAVEHDDHADGHAHPTDMIFVKTAIILAVVTAVEVGWSYLPWNNATGAMAGLEVGGLLLMMAFKFYVVGSVFMHLKYDKKVLTGVFYFGLVIAVAVYIAVLATFEFFWFSGDPEGFCPTNPAATELSVCEPIATN